MSEKKEMNRRGFIKEAGALVGAGLSLSFLASSAMSEEAKKDNALQQAAPSIGEYKKPDEKKIEAKPIELRTLGKTGMKVTSVGMGVMNCSDPAVILSALDIGINFFDTADCYQSGRNEEMVGSVLKNAKARDKVFIETKVHIGEEKAMQDSVDRSLRRLQTDHIDCLVWHGLNSVEDVNSESCQAFMEKQKKAGKVRFTGFSTHKNMAEIISAAADKKKHDIILTTYNFKAGDKLKEAIKKASDAGIGIIAMKTQPGGIQEAEFIGKFDAQQSMLKYVLSDNSISVAIPGVTTIAQIESLAAVGYQPEPALQKSDLNLLRQIDAAIRGQRCVLCGECKGTCPQGNAYSDMLRAASYLENYRNYELAKDTFMNASEKFDAKLCGSCLQCGIQCKQALDIKAKIISAYNMLA